MPALSKISNNVFIKLAQRQQQNSLISFSLSFRFVKNAMKSKILFFHFDCT
jgi:hypothetical protein